ncbi:hypothetical protein PP292_24705, partial [Mycobacteroides abscessus]|nr:hypothetical protein [Mycobacteroides abscessus]MDM1893972.1 hypothetical protein [Mycobacteroides abscessus]
MGVGRQLVRGPPAEAERGGEQGKTQGAHAEQLAAHHVVANGARVSESLLMRMMSPLAPDLLAVACEDHRKLPPV